jgi:hypothetical protein
MSGSLEGWLGEWTGAVVLDEDTSCVRLARMFPGAASGGTAHSPAEPVEFSLPSWDRALRRLGRSRPDGS